MNSGVVQAYGQYGSGQGSQLAPRFAEGYARMSKRRRLDSSDQYGSGVWEQQQPTQQPQQQQQTLYGDALSNVSSFGTNRVGSEYAGAISQEIATGGGVNESSTNNATTHWQHGSASSTYPDVATYSQQPYFYQQTDPSTYNSPWPPPTIGTSTSFDNSYPVCAQSEVMPYFPPQRVVETNENAFDANASVAVQPYQPEVETARQYSYSQSTNARQPQNRGGDAATASSAPYSEDASMHLKVQSLSILENLATQLIHTISKANFPQIQEIMHGSDTEDGQAYTTLKNLFDQTRKVYSRTTPFIDAIAIQMFQPAQQEIIRKANIATFISSILGAHDVSFFHLNEFFMETFIPLGHRLLKWQGAIYLELKTQTYISALMNSDGSPEAMLDELFPSDLDAQILTRHPDAPSLSPSEQDFIDRCRARKNYLLAEDSTEEAQRDLPKKYQWQDFVREFASCISKNVDGIINVPTRSQPLAGDRRGTATSQANAALTATSQQSIGRGGPAFLADNNITTTTTIHPTNATSTDPSRAKSTHNTTAASNTIRQPWTKPEEDALLSGLARVNGPHWSQILALYGRGGSVSEVLKDRNQVQLKDKARNLKLWYLKMGKEVPVALKGVTGELRKRGGARARAALGLSVDDDVEMDGVDDGEAEGLDEVIERGLSRGTGSRKGRKRG